ncbi:hypothetical protein [Streptomyces sp. NBC_00083]|uniref:hypothetical protein n=1 Tax=Streptomyces sp. NBC_00083 TaxID=2975647 RepID=UPI00224D21BD|nr:hypothetical protein [Streptomyces sp. NBC_00083]MCX5384147.1 hypothetical protein [Streptomyces sp. NBC_00083]
MAPARHELDRAWEVATSAQDAPEWSPEQEVLQVYVPACSAPWSCGARRQVLWRLHVPGSDLRPVSVKLVTAAHWQGAVSELAADVDPSCGGTAVTVPHVAPGTYWIQVARGSRLLATSRPFAIGPSQSARQGYAHRRPRSGPPRGRRYPH